MASDPDPRRRDSLPAATTERSGGELQISPCVSRCALNIVPNYPSSRTRNNVISFPDDAVVQARIDARNDEGRAEMRAGSEDDLEDVVVIYNRVPKTASTSFMGLVYDLCKQNKYHVLHINVTNNMHTLTFANQVCCISKKIHVLGLTISLFEKHYFTKCFLIVV